MGLFSRKQKDFEQIRNENEDASLKRVSELLAQVANSTDDTPREGFKEALRQRILEARAKKSMKSVPFFKHKAFAMLAAGGTTAIVVLIISMLVIEPIIHVVPTVYAQDNFTLTAEVSDSLGVDSETTWLLESKTPIVPDEIKEMLSNNLEVPFSISSVDEFSVRVQLDEALESDEVIQFVLDTEIQTSDGTTLPRIYQWAFQAKSQFHVMTSVPGDHATDVPLSTGIEITFSHENVSVEDFEKALTIEPAVAGHAEKYRRSLVWVPDQPLESQSVYKVTLSGALSPDGTEETLGEDYVIEFETEATESRYEYYYLFDYSVSVDSTTPPGIGVSFNRNYLEQLQQATFDVYEFDTVDDLGTHLQKFNTLSWRRYQNVDDIVDVSTMHFVGSFGAVLDSGESSSYGNTDLYMPEALDEGYYFAQIHVADQKLPLFIQVTSLAATIVTADNQSLAWVHDVSLGQPVKDAVVETVGDGFKATTSSDGVALLAIDLDAENEMLFRVSTNNKVLYVKTQSSWYYTWDGYFHGWYSQLNSDTYWSYLSTDRAVYLNDDTVHVFGMLENRATGEVPKTVRVWVELNDYYYQTNSVGTILAETTTGLTDEGTFTTALQLPGMSQNIYGASVRVAIDDETVIVKHIGITEYQKPVLSLDVTLDRRAVFSGEEIKYEIAGTYFDGTPAAWQKVSVRTQTETTEVQLDQDGRYSGSFIPNSGYFYTGGLYRRDYVTAVSLIPGSGEVMDQEAYYEFGSRIEISQTGEIVDGTGTVNIETFNIDPSLVEDTYSYSLADRAYRSGVRANTALSYTVTEVWYEKILSGNVYDPIRKVVNPRYKYSRQEHTVGNGTVTTDEHGLASISYACTRTDASYLVEIREADGNTEYSSSRGYSQRWLHTNYYDDYTLRWDNPDYDDETNITPHYTIGDQVTLNVEQNQELFAMPEGSQFLFMQAQLGVQEYGISKEPSYSFIFEDRDAPNVVAYGILFLGNGYVKIGGSYAAGEYVYFDANERSLNIDLKTDKESYTPGGEATVSLVVTDKDGKPIEADVNISVVDEAYFALFNQVINPLSTVYRTISSGVKSVETSHKAELESELADGKGGGGEDARSDFVDTSAFVTIHTKKDGTGSTTITLADNITTWRITTQAYDGDERLVGTESVNINTTLPFFIRASVQESYLDDDKPNIYVYSAGTAVGDDDEVEYAFEMDNPEASDSIKAKQGEDAFFALPDLEEGDYEITIRGKFGEYTDAIRLPVKILGSRLTRPSITTISLGEDDIPEIEQDAALVSFVDAGIGQYYGRLWRYSWWFGDRADEVAARYAAQVILRDTFDSNSDIEPVSGTAYQEEYLIRLLEHAEGDLILTSKIALLQDTPFDENKMLSGLNSVIDNENSEDVLTTEELAWAYAGMAALGDVRLASIQRLSQEGLSQTERLVTAIALFYAGDYENARAIYRDLMTSAVESEAWGIHWSAESDEDKAEYTSLLAILAAGLQEEGQAGLYDYVSSHKWGQTLINVEDMSYLIQAMKHASTEDSVVELFVNGRDQKLELEKGGSRSWYLSQEQIKELNPQVRSGSVTMVISAQVPISTSDEVYDKISVLRSYQTIDGVTQNTFKADDIVRVQITYSVDPNIPNSAYQITDAVPSGLTPLTSRVRYGGENYCISYPYQADTNQEVSFTVYDGMYRRKGCPTNTITYYARVMNSGTFETEPAVIRSLADVSLINNSKDNGTIMITD